MMMETISVYTKSPLVLTLVASGTAIWILLTMRRRAAALRRKSGPRLASYERDRVYLFNFPSCRTIVSISPFALKVETWLRMNGIQHTVLRKRNTLSSKGQIPFIELNGQEYNESNLIIAKLSSHFGSDDGLTEEQRGCARGLEMMLDNQTALSYFYYRYVESVVDFVSTWEFCSLLMRKFFFIIFPRAFRKRAMQHGIGRNTVAEIYSMGCDDILALSKVLAGKKFLFGDRITTTDCYAFGHLAQILYIPVAYPHKQFMRDRTPDLCDYVDRIRDQLWPDWDQLCMENLHGSKEKL